MSNRICELLGIEKPVIQASMYFLTNAEMVAAVSNAGGFGVLGMSAGQDKFETDIDKNLALLKKEVEKTKKLTDKPFGMTILPGRDISEGSNKMPEGTLQIAKEEGVKALVYAGDEILPEWIDKIHQAGMKVLFRPLTPTVEYMKKIVAAKPDAIIATGFDEGGTLPHNIVGTFAVVPFVVDHANNIPVIAAGGIADPRTVKAAFDLGAEGVYAGTAFLASKESPVAENVKELMLKTNASDLLLFPVPSGNYYRSIPDELTDKMQELFQKGASLDEIYKVSGNFDGLRQAMKLGKTDKGIIAVGLGVSQIHAINDAKTIVNRLYEGIPENMR